MDKRIKFLKINTRQRVFISILILTILYLLFEEVINVILKNSIQIGDTSSFSYDFMKPLVLSIISFILMYWVTEFKIRGIRFITILSFPAVGVFVFSLFVELIITSIFGQIGIFMFILISGGLFMFFSYILFLTANILNIGYLSDIPLGQAGRASYYVLSLFISYLIFFIIISNEINILIQMLLIFLVPFYFVTSSLWTIKLKGGQRILIGFAISIIMIFLYLALSLWPIDVTFIAFILSIFLYILLGVALETRETVDRMIWVEYGSLFVIILGILILISNWGINGSLI